jgi:mono/diheme cytochrome c family protein
MTVRSIAIGVTAMAVGAIALSHDTAHAKAPIVRAVQQEVDGKEVYLKSCKECHGVRGSPTKASLRKYDKMPNFTDPEFFESRKDSALFDAVEKGKGRDMKGFSDKLSKEEMKAVVVYIHTLQKKG